MAGLLDDLRRELATALHALHCLLGDGLPSTPGPTPCKGRIKASFRKPHRKITDFWQDCAINTSHNVGNASNDKPRPKSTPMQAPIREMGPPPQSWAGLSCICQFASSALVHRGRLVFHQNVSFAGVKKREMALQ